MRDIALILVVLFVSCYAIIHPWIGVMGWTLLSIMNVHKLAWAAADLPLAAVLACSTLLGMVVTRDRRRVDLAPATILLVLFILWVCMTLPFSFSVDGSMDMFKKVMKVDFMILVALVLINTRTQIVALAAVLVFSIGFYGLKGGIFTIIGSGFGVFVAAYTLPALLRAEQPETTYAAMLLTLGGWISGGVTLLGLAMTLSGRRDSYRPKPPPSAPPPG